jgi:hypothetical protein
LANWLYTELRISQTSKSVYAREAVGLTLVLSKFSRLRKSK